MQAQVFQTQGNIGLLKTGNLTYQVIFFDEQAQRLTRQNFVWHNQFRTLVYDILKGLDSRWRGDKKNNKCLRKRKKNSYFLQVAKYWLLVETYPVQWKESKVSVLGKFNDYRSAAVENVFISSPKT